MLVSNDKDFTDNRAVGIEGVGGDLGAIASLDFDRSQLALCQPGGGGTVVALLLEGGGGGGQIILAPPEFSHCALFGRVVCTLLYSVPKNI